MKVVLGQVDIVWEDPEANIRRTAEALRTRQIAPDSLIVLPEMWSSGFSMDSTRACHASAAALESLAGFAREHRSWLVAGLAVPEQDGPANCSFGFRPDGTELFRFRKLHGFSLAGEPDHYRPGAGVGVWPMGAFMVAPFICYDLRFPEIFRQASAMGADLMVVIANWPSRREDHWVTLLRARAIENQAWVIGVNRAGTDPTSTYPGRSLVVDPMGVVRADAGAGERWVEVEIDAGEAASWRRDFPALRDRRF